MSSEKFENTFLPQLNIIARKFQKKNEMVLRLSLNFDTTNVNSALIPSSFLFNSPYSFHTVSLFVHLLHPSLPVSISSPPRTIHVM